MGIGTGEKVSTPIMRSNLAKRDSAKYLGKPVGALLLLTCMLVMAGCQGVSAGAPKQSQPGDLILASNTLDFGSIQAGTTKTLTATATNNGSASVTVNQVFISTPYFTMTAPGIPVTVEAGQSTPITIAFTPNTTGPFSAMATIGSDGSDPSMNLTLTGTGAGVAASGTLALNPTSEAFGSVAAGSAQVQTVTLTNIGASTVNISQATVAGTGFQLGGITTPLALNASQSTTFTVKFAPPAAGAATGTVTIVSDGSNPSLTLPLTGTGIATGALASNPSSINFGSITVGSNQTLSGTLTNSGGSSVTISQVATTGSAFSVSGITTPVTLTAGQSTSYSIKFAPVSTGSLSGSLTITSNAPDPTLIVPLSGTGVALGALGSNPTSLSFGSIQVGSNQSLTGTLTNTGGTAVTISQAGITGTGFTLSGISTPITLAPGQGSLFVVKFAPTTGGSASGNVTITSNGSNPNLAIPVSGSGVVPGTLGSNPTSLNFGTVQVGANQSLSETVTNTGGSSVTISSAAVSGTGFTLSGITTPLTLASGQGATFAVKLAPTSAGNPSGGVTITSNASNPTLTIPLSGTAVAAGALGSNPTSLSFGTIQVGTNRSLSGTVTNTGGSTVTISSAAISGTGFTLSGIATPITLAAGQGATFSVKFAPTSAGSASGNVTITSNASNPTLTIPLSGTGATAGALGSNPTSLSFGTIQVGSNQSLSETVTNTGGSSVTISSAAISGTGFTLSGIATPVTLTAGQGATFAVKFAPTAAGSASGSVTITSNASNPTLTIPLSGTGSAAPGQLTVNPTTLAIGSVTVGSNGSGSGTLSATGSNVTVTGASSSSGAFSVSGISLPVTITAGTSVGFTVTFSPSAAGSASGSITFASNAAPSATVESVTGTGVAATPHSVNLSWNASTSTDVTGYDVYRAVFGGSCGSYAKINPSLVGTLAYSDSTVVDGNSYCYATTAVDSSNLESGYSNIVSNLQIPTQ
jgi:Abnormal spindle-like microcephaly-assoc'd, ASPM-SPD-2-Hydin/Protein of unknown function (DUF1573)